MAARAATATEAAFGGPLDWEPQPDNDRGSLSHPIAGSDADARDAWPRQHALLADALLRLYRAVKPFVEHLDTAPEEASDE